MYDKPIIATGSNLTHNTTDVTFFLEAYKNKKKKFHCIHEAFVDDVMKTCFG